MNPGMRFTTTSSVTSPPSQEMRYTVCRVMVRVAEPFGMLQDTPVIVERVDPFSVTVQEESTPEALQVTLVVWPSRTRSGFADMEAEGLVKRVPDPDDRRSVRAVITVEGRRKYEAAAKRLAAAEAELLGSFTTGERELLTGFLEKLRGGVAV